MSKVTNIAEVTAVLKEIGKSVVPVKMPSHSSATYTYCGLLEYITSPRVVKQTKANNLCSEIYNVSYEAYVQIARKYDMTRLCTINLIGDIMRFSIDTVVWDTSTNIIYLVISNISIWTHPERKEMFVDNSGYFVPRMLMSTDPSKGYGYICLGLDYIVEDPNKWLK